MLEKDNARLTFSLITVNIKLTIRVPQICIVIALALSLKKYVNGKFCFNCLKINSICHLHLYESVIWTGCMFSILLKHTIERFCSLSQKAIRLNLVQPSIMLFLRNGSSFCFQLSDLIDKTRSQESAVSIYRIKKAPIKMGALINLRLNNAVIV